jgi:hypothetical protein
MSQNQSQENLFSQREKMRISTYDFYLNTKLSPVTS